MKKEQVEQRLTLYGVLIGILFFFNIGLIALSATGHTISSIMDRDAADITEDMKPHTGEYGADFEAAVIATVEEYAKQQEQNQRDAQIREQEERQKKAQQMAEENAKVLSESDHVFGNRDAEVVMIEYSDFECPFCQRFHPTAKQLVEKYDGKVSWAYRHFPLGFHEGAGPKAEASECVAKLGGNDAFWKFTDTLYEKGPQFSVEDLQSIAEDIGVNGSQFSECLESGEMKEKVSTDMREGSQSGITGTPGTIFLNTKTGKVRLVSGAVPLSALEQAVEEVME